jgi:transposase
LLRASFIPPEPIRELRELTRYRKTQIAERQREANRLHKVLQDAGIKLSSVASNVLGASGRAMVDALVAGTSDPDALARLARGRLRAKTPALRAALEGRFKPMHALLCRQILGHLDFLDEAIGTLDAAIEEQLAPFANEAERLCTIPGVGRRAAQVIISEIGVDMSRFPTAGHLASWAGICPGNNESAGKRKTGKSTKGSKFLRIVLIEAALAASRSKGTYLAAHYQRVKRNRGHRKAVVAVAHTILCLAWQLLSQRVDYDDLGADYFVERDAQAVRRRAVRQLERLGHKVTLEPVSAA